MYTFARLARDFEAYKPSLANSRFSDTTSSERGRQIKSRGRVPPFLVMFSEHPVIA
jgi:hypothetical protein